MSLLILTFYDCFLGFCLCFCILPQNTKTLHKTEHEQDKVLMKWTLASAANIIFPLKIKSLKNPLFLSEIISSPFYLDKFFCISLDMKECRAAIFI